MKAESAACRWCGKSHDGLCPQQPLVWTETCRWCGNHHAGKCPLVRAIEYYPDGAIKRVEFAMPADNPPSLPSPSTPQPWQPPWQGPWV